MFKCPDCGASKFKDFNECNICGWSKPNFQKKQNQSDGRCEYRHGIKRCDLPGSISPNMKEGGPWYCNYHFEDSGRNDETMKFIEKYFGEIMHERRCSNNFYFHIKKCERCAEWQKTKILKLREMLDEDSKKYSNEDVVNF